MEKLSIEQRFSDIEYNINKIKERISEACIRSGRKENEVRLMAVTKTVEPIFINHAIDCGIDLIGENKVQEFLSKKEHLRLEGCEAHLIGHLQTNKVRQIISEVSMIQSVDSVKLAKEISKRSESAGIVSNCLVEVNIGGEESKTGIDGAYLEELICEISEMKAIKIKGLMTIPPICDDERVLNKYFSKMHRIFIDIKDKKLDNVDMTVLSMGMSSDYENAVMNGSTLVRVGTALFGQRIY
ncbi:MAG: YggS family pyridoxal phosphate-dependent enzyme [Acutalibacteraceae bacterium]|nr:YggS family pyridoxal phosphate-dependent enzyme [Acutalibacteraceae bacterium]